MKRLNRPVYTPSNLNCNLLQRLRDNDSALRRIVFSSRNLGSKGANTLAQALQTNTNLAALDLSSNSIGSKGAEQIASLLQHQTMIASRGGIRTLILADNALHDDGVKAMADALEKDIMIEHLSLDGNSIGASGLAVLANALQRNTRLKRLHLRHNSFQSLSPLITCTFNKESLNSVADSNHTLKHVFLNCGYTYECEELEMIVKINRMGKVEARRKKLALFLEECLESLFLVDMDAKLLPRMLGIIAYHGNISTMFRMMQHSEVLFSQGFQDPMDVDDPMDVECLSR